MSDQPITEIDDRLRELARAFAFPPTPDIAGAVRARLVAESGRTTIAGRTPQAASQGRLSWVAAAVALGLLLAASLAVPEVQAFVRTVIARIGSIEIVLTPATPTPTGTITPGTPGPTPSATPIVWDPQLVGETTLEDARRRLSFPLRLPSYPVALGEPDRVFVQDLDGPAVIFAWLDKAHSAQPLLILYELSSGAYGEKLIDETTILQETTVNGQPALWVQGPHVVEIRGAGGYDIEPRRLVEGNVLNWEDGGVTYRLESKFSLEEALRVAESLEPRANTPARTPTIAPPTPPVGLSSLSGETTLEGARSLVSFNILLPTYPPDIGKPDRVFVQDLNGPAALLAWTEPGQPDKVKMALQQLSGMVSGEKEVSNRNWVDETRVNGTRAVWVRGPHVLSFYRRQGLPSYHVRRLIEGDVLIWVVGGHHLPPGKHPSPQ